MRRPKGRAAVTEARHIGTGEDLVQRRELEREYALRVVAEQPRRRRQDSAHVDPGQLALEDGDEKKGANGHYKGSGRDLYDGFKAIFKVRGRNLVKHPACEGKGLGNVEANKKLIA